MTCSPSAIRAGKLSRSFYDRPTLEVASDLIGKYIVYRSDAGLMSGRIVEVEAYIGEDDPACHASRGRTKRNAVMFGKPGYAYIYLIYGMYHCLNFVTEPEGKPSAVLLRAAEPIDGFELMLNPHNEAKRSKLLSGPGKFCRAFNLGLSENGLDLTGDRLYLENRKNETIHVATSQRIGISSGLDKLWRFYDLNSNAVSALRKGTQLKRKTIHAEKGN